MSDAVTQVAIVTGGARGIGAATVLGLADVGFAVVAVDRCCDDPRLPYALADEADLHASVAAATAVTAPGRVTGVICDVTDPIALAQVVADAETRWGGVDVVIAGAGVVAGGLPQWAVPPEQEAAVLDACLTGTLVTARVGIPALLRRPTPRRGRFVAIASTAATRGLPMLAAYCAAKAGVVGLVRALAAELRGSGVTANAVSPGSTATAILEESARLYDLPDDAAFATQQPIERLLTAAEVASMIVWLAGPGGAAVTGAAIPVDGGLSV